MASSGSFYAASPTVVMQPSQVNPFFPSGAAHYSHHTAASTPTTPAAAAGPTPNGTLPGSPSKDSAFALANAPVQPSPGALAGRKRSRGDANSPADETSDPMNDGSVAVGRPGKTLLYSGSPASECAIDSDPFHMAIDDDSAVLAPATSRKNQRLDSSPSRGDHLAQLVLPPQMREATAEPLIDEATRTLGISWVRMDSSEALLISRAAYAKFIQNHYPGLKDVAVWFENSAIPGYLVEASNAYTGAREYYIFSNDLHEARRVTSEPSQLVPRLKMLPALHLAAPGGCLRANIDGVSAGHDSLDGAHQILSNRIRDEVSQQDEESEFRPPIGLCAAHSMEMD